MPTKSEKDLFEGKPTTGHEWDGVRELDLPLPKWWLWVLYATIAWSIVYFVLYPSVPYVTGYFRGVLEWNSREDLAARMEEAKAGQARFVARIRVASAEEIRADPELLGFALAGGKAAFADNCAPCHGLGGAGRPGFPSLADDVWIWGGRLADIEKTIRDGVRVAGDGARSGSMPNFGEGTLKPDQISDVAEHVLSFTGRATNADAAARGAAIFAEQCAVCHGARGGGNAELGAPRLDTSIWTYGGTKADIVRQVTKPRLGVMPAWSGRLDDHTIKMLAVYVHGLGGGK